MCHRVQLGSSRCRGRYPPAAPTPSTPSRSTPPTPSSTPACIGTYALDLDLDLNSRSTTAACHFSCTPNFFLNQQLKWLGSSSDTASANGGISPAPLSPGYSRPVPSATGIAMDAAGLGSVGGGGGLPQSAAGVEERPCAEVYQAVRELQERKDYAGSGDGVRVSLATAKFKRPPPSELSVSVSAPGGYPGVWLPTSVSGDQHPHQPSLYQPPPPSVSAPIAGHYPNGEPPGYTPEGGLTTSASGPEYFASGPSPNRLLAPNGGGGGGGGNCKPQADEWRHTAQGRAILGNLIRPNGEPLTSTDAYNTTVPVGKHCGFVQFVRKADAERAIKKMQGFPVGGSRIRLSWGRSQYKAAQAAAQAAQAALAQQGHHPPPPPTQQMPVLPQQIVPPIPPAAAVASSAAGANGVANGITPAMPDGMTHEQAVALFQKFQMQGFAAFSGPPAGVVNGNGYEPATTSANVNGGYAGANGAGNEQPHRNGGSHALSPNSGGGGVGEGQSNGQQQAQQQQQPHFTDESRTVQEGRLGMRRMRRMKFRRARSRRFGLIPISMVSNSNTSNNRRNSSSNNDSRLAGCMLRRMMPYGGAQRGRLGVPTGKSYTPSFLPVQPSIQTSGGSAAVPICGRGGYAGSPPAFQVIRYQEPRPISRPGSGAACGGAGEQLRVERIVGGELLFDPMHDLNGTLVSLDLDREREREYAWGLKSPTVTESKSAEMKILSFLSESDKLHEGIGFDESQCMRGRPSAIILENVWNVGVPRELQAQGMKKRQAVEAAKHRGILDDQGEALETPRMRNESRDDGHFSIGAFKVLYLSVWKQQRGTATKRLPHFQATDLNRPAVSRDRCQKTQPSGCEEAIKSLNSLQFRGMSANKQHKRKQECTPLDLKYNLTFGGRLRAAAQTLCLCKGAGS
ncbi:hypothetical protein R3P38DRAFT_3366349 [Favolaschia claudopus]|uniref:RRM domain-containing protein n=1 Tax=Favolaschia claudopus TaxID=2862362 RepID=A0AAW0ADT8_9AGAR